MKKIFTISILFILLFSMPNFAQAGWNHGKGRMLNKLAQIEKLKLIELLNLDEDTAIRLFARRNKNLERQKELIKEKNELISRLRKMLKEKDKKDSSLKNMTKKILELERAIIENRIKFFDTLKDILTEEQIAKYLVFEHTLRNEIRNYMMHRHGWKK